MRYNLCALTEPSKPPPAVAEELELLVRVLQSLQGRGLSGLRRSELPEQYARELIGLRDEIAEARLEDVAALVAQMERLQEVAASRVQVQELLVDEKSPYFGHLLRDWEAYRGIRWRVKLFAVGMVVTVSGLTATLRRPPDWAKWSAAGLGAVGIGTILFVVPTVWDNRKARPSGGSPCRRSGAR